MHQERANAVDRLGELSDDRMIRVEHLASRQARQRADHADAQAFVHLIRSVKPAIAELQVGNAEAGQSESGRAAEPDDRVASRRADRRGQTWPSECGRIRFGATVSISNCSSFMIHVGSDLLQLFQFGGSDLEFDRLLALLAERFLLLLHRLVHRGDLLLEHAGANAEIPCGASAAVDSACSFPGRRCYASFAALYWAIACCLALIKACSRSASRERPRFMIPLLGLQLILQLHQLLVHHFHVRIAGHHLFDHHVDAPRDPSSAARRPCRTVWTLGQLAFQIALGLGGVGNFTHQQIGFRIALPRIRDAQVFLQGVLDVELVANFVLQRGEAALQRVFHDQATSVLLRTRLPSDRRPRPRRPIAACLRRTSVSPVRLMLKISLFCWKVGDQLVDQPLHLVRLAGQYAERFHTRRPQGGLNHEVAFQVRQLSALENFKLFGRIGTFASPSTDCSSLDTLNSAVTCEVSGNTNQRMIGRRRGRDRTHAKRQQPAASQAVGEGIGIHPAAEHVGRRQGCELADR